MNNHKHQWQKIHDSKKSLIEAFKDKKFGMFIHFGLYSMLAGEYKNRRIEEGRKPYVAEWIMHAFSIPREEYKMLMTEFNPTKFSADYIVKLAKKAGMKYIVITSKHHEGFALYDSKVSDFNIINTPYGKDLINELYNACKKGGIDFGLYYSHSIDWADGGDGGMRSYKNSENRVIELHAYNEYDPSPLSYDEYIKTKAIPQVKEILKMFPNLSNIWFDVAYYIPEKYSFEFYQIVYDIQPNALISERIGNEYGDVACPGDNKIPHDSDTYTGAWETVGTMNNSWGFKHYDHDWKYPKETLFWLVEIVSKGGNYMLNIGPDGDGNVPKENVEILTEIGDWMNINGEAIYGTRKWNIGQEGPLNLNMDGTDAREDEGFSSEFTAQDIWFTSKENNVYCISLYSGKIDKLVIKSLKEHDIAKIVLLNGDIELNWERTQQGIQVKLPDSFTSEIGFALKAQLKK